MPKNAVCGQPCKLIAGGGAERLVFCEPIDEILSRSRADSLSNWPGAMRLFYLRVNDASFRSRELPPTNTLKAPGSASHRPRAV